MSDVAKVRSRSVGRRPIHRLELRAFRPGRVLTRSVSFESLNAPSGAQCFPTWSATDHRILLAIVSMHLLALSAFRRLTEFVKTTAVLSQCTFWCSVLSDQLELHEDQLRLDVSMHLLVLSAFRLEAGHLFAVAVRGLNAPSGAQCFPTVCRGCVTRCFCRGLNAPSGAQCFPTSLLPDPHVYPNGSLNAPSGAQCFPTSELLPRYI